MKKNIWILILVVIVLLILLLLKQCGGGTVTSYFDIDDESWLVGGDVQSGNNNPDYIKDEGKSGGYISAKDDAVGGVWYWLAPPKFLGDISSAYGKKLEFSLKQSSINNQFDDADVILSNGEITLVYDTPNNPGIDWTDYMVLLEEKEWHYSTSYETAVTKEDFIKVLKNLKALKIRGEFVSGGDTGGLDNVVLYK